jgi:hypothetical protein
MFPGRVATPFSNLNPKTTLSNFARSLRWVALTGHTMFAVGQSTKIFALMVICRSDFINAW